MSYVLWALIGYLAGSCPTGYVVVKLVRGADIRNYGSGNIGATNVGRVMGKKWAVVVSVFDMLKGGLAVLAAWALGANHVTMALTGVCAVLGHDFPVWLKFKGGKGVSTTFGVLAFFDFFNPWVALLGGIIWYGVMRYTLYVSVASMLSLTAAAVLTYFFGMDPAYTVATAFLAALTIWRHRENIRRLVHGAESKVKGYGPKKRRY